MPLVIDELDGLDTVLQRAVEAKCKIPVHDTYDFADVVRSLVAGNTSCPDVHLRCSCQPRAMCRDVGHCSWAGLASLQGACALPNIVMRFGPHRRGGSIQTQQAMVRTITLCRPDVSAMTPVPLSSILPSASHDTRMPDIKKNW